jgi:hypothetical protein
MPYRIMARVSERCVIPNTIEANSAKSSTAVKCEGVYIYRFLPSFRLCASTAEMKLSSPATTINFVP